MKVLAVSASPRGAKSRTLQLVQAAADEARKAGAQVETVDLSKLAIKYCTGCGVCYAKGKCVHRDDFGGLYDDILACDGLILGSPNYFRSVTAQLKTVIDRMADAIHCQLLTGKYGCAIATAGGPAHREVTDYLTAVLIGFGANVVGSAGAAAAVPGAMDAAEKEARSLGKALVDAIREKRPYPEQEAIHKETRARFKKLVGMNRDAWPHEYQYWRSLGEV